MASKRELEERIDKLEKHFNRYQGKVHSLENEVFQKDQEEYWKEKQEDTLTDTQKEIVSLAKRTCGKDFSEEIENKIKKENQEPKYLQVGDQWRDEEGNEYVLGMWKKHENVVFPYRFFLVNKETGRTVKDKQVGSSENKLSNKSANKETLGITDNMTKIK